MIRGFVATLWSAAIGHKVAIAFYAGLVACIAIGATGLYQWGRAVAEGECKAAAKQAEIDALILDRDAANDRADRAGRIVAALNERRYVTEQEIARLQRDLERAKLQSTQPGAKHDPSALLDDQCHYTDRGLQQRRLRR
ncbi:MAG: hypothetical protein AB7V13_08320 [Pseudorhodoplanes sp.]|uniref:hypothetical protein n=1 Tax=Pseudorhodoplanes sp. TaxID=1934341 RepID=UPI003D09EC93